MSTQAAVVAQTVMSQLGMDVLIGRPYIGSSRDGRYHDKLVNKLESSFPESLLAHGL